MAQPIEFEEFYQANCRRTVALVAAATGDRARPRTLPRRHFPEHWPGGIPSADTTGPEAWVRQVALRLTVDSRRRMLCALHLWRRPSAVRPTESAATAEIESSDIGDALLRFPVGQRQVLVVHYFADLSVEAISQEHGIPVER